MQPSSTTSTLSSRNSTNPNVLIFDSGVGALSVFSELTQLEPSLKCTLALDNAHFPYGTLSEQQLVDRVVEVIGKLIGKVQPDLAVIACNSASTVVLDELRQKFDIPFVGVVPAIKPAAKVSKSKTLGLLATPGTVARTYTDSLIEDFAPDCEILRVGSSDLVYMAEKKLRGSKVDESELTKILAPFIEHPELDTLVLACTHFPLLNEEILSLIPKNITLLDSGYAIAQRVSSLLSQVEYAADKEQAPKHQLFFTAIDPEIDALERHFETLGIKTTEVIGL